ncbi:MAG: hypothetical protein AB7O96_01370 [Pseudobdellovibrionaceae bacterium]
MSNTAKDLKYVMCPGSCPDPDFYKYYDKIFDCWSTVWKDALVELKANKQLHSDAFTRQDYIGAIFWKDHCVALSFFRWTYAFQKAFSQDSYFSNWTDNHQDSLRSRGDKIIVCSYFTVHPLARGTQLGFSGKDLMMGMIIETFLGSKADGMTGAVRVNKHVNEASVRWGGLEIAKEIPSGFQDTTVDLIGFFKDHIESQPSPDLKPLCNELWQNRLMIPRLHAEFDYQERAAPPVKPPVKKVA